MIQPKDTKAQSAGRLRKRVLLSLAAALAIYLLLLIPDPDPAPPPPPTRRPFAWNQDARWEALEARFDAARREDPATLRERVRALLAEGERRLSALRDRPVGADDPLLAEIEELVFVLGASAAACPGAIEEFLRLAVAMRDAVKEQSAAWNMDDAAVRGRLYRLLYGGRAATEEAMLQAPPGGSPTLLCRDEPSRTPAARVLGVEVHSGDVLVSRGGAPTSALIARGSDFPGNFSHVALLHVDESGAASVVEAHIECGVTVQPIDAYLRDRKLRVMVLRLRADLPALRADPMLPHRAASAAREEAAARHIPYDFAMDYEDPSKVFCSEVASAAYRKQGVTLWMGLSHISSPGVRDWLSSFGVRSWTTQEPSDLEYDPQLRVVAEWRDPEALFRDHVDNAATDVLLEEAERGSRLDYPALKLPFARAAKAWSAILNRFGGIGPVPEGMSATAALKHERYGARHAALAAGVLERAREFRDRRGYAPPYWELLKLARETFAPR